MSTSDVIDRLAIKDLVCLYAHCVDRRDFERLQTLFTADAIQQVRHLELEYHNRDEIIAGISQIEQMFESTYHAVHNQLVLLEDDRAEGETYCVARHFNTAEDGSISCYEMGIRYQDEFLRTAEGWQFSRRELLVDYQDQRLLNAP